MGCMRGLTKDANCHGSACLSVAVRDYFSLINPIYHVPDIRLVDGRPLQVGKKNNIENQLQTRSKTHKNESTQTVSKAGRELHGDGTSEASLIANAPPTVPPSVVIGSSQAPPPPAHGVSDFRPTTPGHSPGAGHSIQN
ncbi:hypothetical protein FEM48_Zijuj08G0114300 [Ziziphus jujuba var. spinosa]|uniref:Uncharacterized protein n=1 Tax=Ziziphus jujuba var. spinosa TaxID=714518 RepID=A0A978UYT8_ZIZJJ|nr:hypothetical protein FEM48_Zijuj08G0114300 [Ziziphus jujuba var. spinosa]